MIRSLYWEQHPPSTAGLQVLLFVPRTFCKSKSGSGCDVFVLFCDVIRCAFGPLRVAPVVASRVASGMVPSLFVPSPNRRRHPLSSCCICKRVCVCSLAWPRAILLSVPLPPLQRCHHTVAGDRCLGTPSWLCPSEQMGDQRQILRDGSHCRRPRQLPNAQFDRSGSTTTAGWHRACRLARNSWRREE